MTDFELAWKFLPHSYFLIDVDVPKFTVVGASDTHLDAIGVTREYVIGKGLFDSFPDNEESEYHNSNDLFKSLTRVIETKKADIMKPIRYDVPKESGGFDFRYWSVINSPVIKDGEVINIINSAADITTFFKK